MAYVYEYIDGERVEVNVAHAFRAMDAAFRAAFGFGLHINSGTRTRSEQAELYRLMQCCGGNLAAPPGSSNHEEDGPNGPRSIDIRDDGNDPGVMTRGTTRDRWMQDHAGEFGFENEGYGFSRVEAWHKTFRGSIGGAAGGGGGGNSAWSQDTVNQQNWLNAAFGAGLDVDGFQGDKTTAKIKDYQTVLRAYGYTGAIDGDWGAGTQAAHERYFAEWLAKQQDSSGVPAFPLGAGEYFGPEAGGDSSISGYHSHNEDLKRWQQRMADRGWPITVDGLYGAQGASTPAGNTYDVALAFQQEKSLVADGLIGPETWTAAWTAPITGAQSVPVPVPTPIPTPNDPVDPSLPTDGTNYSSRSVGEIQAFLVQNSFLAAAYATNSYDTNTSRAVGAFQRVKFVDVDGVWGRTSDGLAFPPVGSIHGVDYSFARPGVQLLKGRGVKFAARYLASLENKKGLQRAEYDELTAAGLEVPFIYEEDGRELLGGYQEGVRIATKAEEHRNRNGFAAKPIYFNVDFDASDTSMPAILDALRGVASVIGLKRVGLYAGYGPLKAAFDAGVITWGFQTYAWSGGRWDVRAQLQQWSNGQWGDSVDFTRAVAVEYGQHAVVETPVPDPTPEPEPTPDPSQSWTITRAEYERVHQQWVELGEALAALDEG